MRQRLFGLAAILLAASGVSAYAECVRPPPLADVTTKVDTEGAVGKVLTIAGISLKADIEVERKSIFTQFPNANQMVVALVAIYQYCTQLEAVKTLTDEQKLEKLAAYQTTWLMAAVGPQAIATTADKKDGAAPDKPRSEEKRSDWMLNGAPVLRVAMDDTPLVRIKPGKISWGRHLFESGAALDHRHEQVLCHRRLCCNRGGRSATDAGTESVVPAV